MSIPDLKLRPATRADAAHMAQFVNLAGEGMPYYLWSKATDGDPWDHGRKRAERDEGGFSWRNTVIADIADEPAGAIITYLTCDTPDPIHDETPAMFVPLIELENMVPGTRYVNVLATYAEHRGNGIGTALLKHALEIPGANGMSIIVADRNETAARLYHSLGFREHTRRPIVKDAWRCASDAWVLLTRP